MALAQVVPLYSTLSPVNDHRAWAGLWPEEIPESDRCSCPFAFSDPCGGWWLVAFEGWSRQC